MADPFLSIMDFKAEFNGTLSAGDELTATRLLTVLSDWIRERKPDVDEARAKQVVFEVVRDAANYGDLERFSSFQNITSRRQEAATFDEDAKFIDDYLTPKHRRFLGIAAVAEPLYNFPECDY